MTENTGITEVTELAWDDEIEDEGSEFILLPEGEYEFKVKSVERQRYEPKPGSKIQECNVAIVDLVINHQGQEVTVKDRFYLLSDRKWLIANFFVAIGLMEPEGTMTMNWSGSVNKVGRCKITHNEYNGEKYANVKSYIKPGKKETNTQSVW